MVEEFSKTVGLRRLRCLHVNDSLTALGSNRDRHAPPGDGEIGPRGCAAFLSEPRFEKLPALFEGPGVDGHAPEKVDVDKMKKLRSERPARAQAAPALMSARPSGSAAAGSRPRGR